MGKKLSEMTLEELSQLFPIRLTEHQPCFKEWYSKEEAFLKKAIPGAERISHIGSTAVSAIWAKPIVDILAEVPGKDRLSDYRDVLVRQGYLCMSESADRISLHKGYTENGFDEKVFHLHIRYAGDHDELYFRDYLMEHPDAAKEYEKLKLGLSKEYEHDRDGYTQAKGGFIREHTEKAKQIYQGRYDQTEV